MKTLNRKAMYDLVKLNDLNPEILKKYNRSYQTLPDFLLHDFLVENGYIVTEDEEDEIEDIIIEADNECDCECCDEGSTDYVIVPKEDWYGMKALLKALTSYYN